MVNLAYKMYMYCIYLLNDTIFSSLNAAILFIYFICFFNSFYKMSPPVLVAFVVSLSENAWTKSKHILHCGVCFLGLCSLTHLRFGVESRREIHQRLFLFTFSFRSHVVFPF